MSQSQPIIIADNSIDIDCDPGPPMLVLSRQPTLNRNVCTDRECRAPNLSRTGYACTTCGRGFPHTTRCPRCQYVYGPPFRACIHCHWRAKLQAYTHRHGISSDDGDDACDDDGPRVLELELAS